MGGTATFLVDRARIGDTHDDSHVRLGRSPFPECIGQSHHDYDETCASQSGGRIAAPVDSPVTIQTSQLFLTIKNVSGQALNDITIGIKPTGVRPAYQTSLRRLANGEDRDVPLTEFRGVDRDALNIHNIKVRSVNVVATDLNGTRYEVELPWE